MKLLYAQEHTSCKNYDSRERTRIGIINIEKENDWNFFAEEGKIIIITEGKLRFSFGDYPDREINKGEFFHLPPGYKFTSRALEETSIVIIRIYSQMQLCECFATESLMKEKEEDFEYDLTYLTANDLMWDFLDSLHKYISLGCKCCSLLEVKVKEFFFMLRAFYTKKELLHFFFLHLTNDISFSEFIHQNYHKAKTAQELADISNYSLSGLQKRFKKVFGVSVYNWMLDMRAKNILQDINNTDKSFKEISNMYGFSSPAHFSNFCKSQFNATPGRIRKEGVVNAQNLIARDKKGSDLN